MGHWKAIKLRGVCLKDSSWGLTSRDPSPESPAWKRWLAEVGPRLKVNNPPRSLFCIKVMGSFFQGVPSLGRERFSRQPPQSVPSQPSSAPNPRACRPTFTHKALIGTSSKEARVKRSGPQQTFLQCSVWFAKDSLALDVWRRAAVVLQVPDLGTAGRVPLRPSPVTPLPFLLPSIQPLR